MSGLQIIYYGADMPWKDLADYGFRRRNTCLLREFVQHPEVERVVVVTGTTREAMRRRRLEPANGNGTYHKALDAFSYAVIPGQRWIAPIRLLNHAIARRTIQQSLDPRHLDRVVQWCYWPEGYQQAREIGMNGPIVFDADNDILSCPNLAEERESIERTMTDCVRRTEAIVGASRRVLEWCESRGVKRTQYLRNGVDMERFRKVPLEPKDLKSLARPRVGYVGTLSRWLDVELLEAVAKAHPEWSLVLIGEEYRTDLPAALKSRPNVHLLGGRIASEVPAYLMNFDVGIVAYRTGEGSNGDTDSMKLFEYLAAGTPVVTTPFRDSLAEDFDHLVEVADGPEAFCAAIEKALTMPPQQRQEWDARRKSFLEANTWRRRADEAVQLMKGLVG